MRKRLEPANEELTKAKADEKYKAFVKRFNPYEDGNSSKRVLARVIER